MASIDRTTYPRFRGPLSERELEGLFAPTEQERRFVRRRAETDHGRLSILVLLKCHQYLGFLPALSDVPSQITRYLRHVLGVPPSTPLRAAPRQVRQRYREMIHGYLRIRPYAHGGREVATGIMRTVARTMSDPADLINAAIEQLIHDRFELPAYSALDRLAGRVRQEVHEDIYATVTERLGANDAARLKALLVVRTRDTRGAFHRLKEPPGRPTLTEMRSWVEHLDWLDGMLSVDTATLLGSVAHSKRRQFAAEARALEVGDMRKIWHTPKRHTLLVCLIHRARAQARDALATMFLKRIRRIHGIADDKLAQLRDDNRETEERMVTALSQVAEHAATTTANASLGRKVRGVLDALGGAETVHEQCQHVSACYNNSNIPLLWNAYRTHRSALLQLVRLLRIESATHDSSLVEALRFVLKNQHMRRDRLPTGIDLSFSSERWKAQIEHHLEDGTVLDRRYLEVCVLSYVAHGLRCGDLFVPGSETFADYREQLLPWRECEERLSDYCEGLDLPTDAQSFVKMLMKKLTLIGEKVDKGYRKNKDLHIDTDGRPQLKRLRPLRAPAGAADLMKKVRERMPERHLLDILRDVHHWTAGLIPERAPGPLAQSGRGRGEAASRRPDPKFAFRRAS